MLGFRKFIAKHCVSSAIFLAILALHKDLLATPQHPRFQYIFLFIEDHLGENEAIKLLLI